MKLIVGLGNPGKEYAASRHNAGFLVVEALADGATWTSMPKLHAEIAKIKTSFFLGQTILLAKPTTFMNLSGESVRAVASYYKVKPEDILIIQDEMDLAQATFAFLAKGGPAGHNGIMSIHEHMGRTDIARLRVGVGRPTPPIAKEDWVLGKMDDATLAAIPRGSQAAKDWAAQGIAKAMTTWNRK